MAGLQASERSLVGWVVVPVLSLIAVLLLLLVSEVAMTPPLLAPHSSPRRELTGKWKGTARVWIEEQQELRLSIDLNIARDGRVEGSIGQSRIQGRLEPNRSWLGRSLNLRTDYIIVGEVMGFVGRPTTAHEKFSMPLNLTGTYFKGSMFVGRRQPSRVSLFKFGAHERSRGQTRLDLI